MMKKHKIFFVIIILGILLAGCFGTGEKSRKPDSDISRGLLLEENASSLVEFTVDAAGEMIRVLIPFQEENQETGFKYIRLNAQAVVEVEKVLDVELGRFLRIPHIVPSGTNLHLFWAAREDSKEDWQLRHLILDQEGSVVFGPQILTKPGRGVSIFEVIGDQSGEALVTWEDITSGDILFARISQTGEILQDAEILVKEGENPSIRRDTTGKFHLAWMREADLFYAHFDPAEKLPLAGNKLTRIPTVLGHSMEGPILGITPDHVFVFWSILRRTGLEAGTAITDYIVFPTGRPYESKQYRLNVFPDPEGFNKPYQGTFNLFQLVQAPTEDYYSTDYVYSPKTLPILNEGLAVAVVANQNVRLGTNVQIIIGIFEEGIYQGYSVATKSTQISRDPRINVDQSGNLYLIWREGTSGGRVYYATSSPAGKMTLDKVIFADFPAMILTGGLEALTGVLLFPFAFPWMAVGLLIMIIWRLVRNDEDITLPLSKVLLAISLISYQISKLLIFPDIILYVPFSAWIDIPPGFGTILRIGLPILFFGLGLLVAERRRHRKPSAPSTISYYIITVVVDTVLTLAVYGVVFMGEY